jgi:beta-mannosidase
MKINLNNLKWQIKGFWPNVPFLGKSIELGNPLLGVTDWIDATVPGGVHFDLLKSGVIEDPDYEMNSLKCEWVENRWWMYKTTFKIDKNLQNKSLTLIFKGVDYKAHFYINGEKLGFHEGMFEEVRFDISKQARFEEENEIQALIENAPEEMAQIGYTSMTKTQKSRFGYKWDFGTRLVNLGIWDDVILQISDVFTFENTFVSGGINCSSECRKGYIDISTTVKCKINHGYDIEPAAESDFEPGAENDCDFNIQIKVELNDKILFDIKKDKKDCIFDKFSGQENNTSCQRFNLNEKILIDNPEIWQTNGLGEHPLYKVTIQVFNGETLSDEEEYFTGIRSVEYRQNEKSSPDSLPYTFVINGIPTYIKGVNMTPLDLMYGNVTNEKYDEIFFLLKKANINMVRVWGGGIIEKEYFYHLCDLNGIMVWQEFIQSSSGIDNTPSEDPHYLELLRKTAIQAVKTKRNHVSHILWSGGNELTDQAGNPVNYENKNIGMLMEIVSNLDPGKLFLPTSASGPHEFLDIKKPGNNHDVHGSWKYEGIKNHYSMFNQSDSLFHSEFGVDGMSCFDSLSRFMGADHLLISNMTDDLVWRHHGEWWDTLSRDSEIFGQIEDLKSFTKASQFMQAEGLRYALEANRRRKYENSGSIIWQFNEPWPNVSNTCLVDYYKNPKMAYYWVKKAYNGVFASLQYNKLNWSESEEFEADVFLHNSLDIRTVELKVSILDLTGSIIFEKIICDNSKSNSCSKIEKIKIALKIPPMKNGIFFVRLCTVDLKTYTKNTNLYIFSQKDEKIFSGLLNIKGGKLEITRERDIDKNRIDMTKTENESANADTYHVTNIGTELCCFVHGMSTDDTPVYIDKNYESLFPGESSIFKLERLNDGEDDKNLNIKWDYLNS